MNFSEIIEADYYPKITAKFGNQLIFWPNPCNDFGAKNLGFKVTLNASILRKKLKFSRHWWSNIFKILGLSQTTKMLVCQTKIYVNGTLSVTSLIMNSFFFVWLLLFDNYKPTFCCRLLKRYFVSSEKTVEDFGHRQQKELIISFSEIIPKIKIQNNS